MGVCQNNQKFIEDSGDNNEFVGATKHSSYQNNINKYLWISIITKHNKYYISKYYISK